MPSVHDYGPGSYSVALFLLGLLLFLSPLATWWAGLTPRWFVPYLLWLGFIVLTALVARRMRRHDL